MRRGARRVSKKLAISSGARYGGQRSENDSSEAAEAIQGGWCLRFFISSDAIELRGARLFVDSENERGCDLRQSLTAKKWGKGGYPEVEGTYILDSSYNRKPLS